MINNSKTDPTPGDAKPSRGLKWPVMIIGLLSLNICVCAITVIAATSNPPFIEPDYYNKGLNWDEQRAKDTDSAATKSSQDTSENDTED